MCATAILGARATLLGTMGRRASRPPQSRDAVAVFNPSERPPGKDDHFAFVREDLGRARGCALPVDHRRLLDRGISLLGWVRNLLGFHEAREPVGFDRFLHVQAWFDRGLARLAVQRGLQVTAA